MYIFFDEPSTSSLAVLFLSVPCKLKSKEAKGLSIHTISKCRLPTANSCYNQSLSYLSCDAKLNRTALTAV